MPPAAATVRAVVKATAARRDKDKAAVNGRCPGLSFVRGSLHGVRKRDACFHSLHFNGRWSLHHLL